MSKVHSEQLRQEILEAGVEVAHNEHLNVAEIARELGKLYNTKWGAISNRIRNIVYLETNGKRGRQIVYAPPWVEQFYKDNRRDI